VVELQVVVVEEGEYWLWMSAHAIAESPAIPRRWVLGLGLAVGAGVAAGMGAAAGVEVAGTASTLSNRFTKIVGELVGGDCVGVIQMTRCRCDSFRDERG